MERLNCGKKIYMFDHAEIDLEYFLIKRTYISIILVEKDAPNSPQIVSLKLSQFTLTHVYIYSQSIVHFNIFNFISLAICSFPFSLSPFFLLKQIANPILLANSAFARLVVVHHSPCIFSWTFYSIDFPASFPRFFRHRCSFKPAFHSPSQLPRTTIGPKSFHVSCKTRKLAG